MCQRPGTRDTIYPPEELTEFIEFHPRLRFLGLAFTKACKADIFTSEPPSSEGNGAWGWSANKRKRVGSTGESSSRASSSGGTGTNWWHDEIQCFNLVVTGTADESQLLEMLRRYSERPSYVMKALNDLFTLIRSPMTTPRIDIIQLVLDCANQCHSVLGIQLAVTACLYDLSKARTGSTTRNNAFMLRLFTCYGEDCLQFGIVSLKTTN